MLMSANQSSTAIQLLSLHEFIRPPSSNCHTMHVTLKGHIGPPMPSPTHCPLPRRMSANRAVSYSLACGQAICTQEARHACACVCNGSRLMQQAVGGPLRVAFALRAWCFRPVVHHSNSWPHKTLTCTCQHSPLTCLTCLQLAAQTGINGCTARTLTPGGVAPSWKVLGSWEEWRGREHSQIVYQSNFVQNVVIIKRVITVD